MKKTVLSLALVATVLSGSAQDANLPASKVQFVEAVEINGTPLNVPGIQTFTIASGERHVRLEWKAVKEESLERYQVERSTDGIHFENAIAVRQAGQGSYTATDDAPQVGMNYYRVRTITQNGDVLFSPTREVRMALPATTRTVYPTDNRAGIVYLLLSPDTDDVTVTVYAANGAILRTPLSREGHQFALDLRGLPSGLYYVAVDAAGTRSTHRVNYQP